MKTFRTVAVVKHPRELVWLAVRDHMSDLVPRLEDVTSVLTQRRTEEPDGTIVLVNLWQARTDVPSVLKSLVKPDMLAWTDQAEWDERLWECQWQIQPVFVSGGPVCAGKTHFEPAIGGRGTRLAFNGSLDISKATIPGMPGLLAAASTSAIESFVATLIPRNFLKLAQAAGQYLDAVTTQRSAVQMDQD